MKKRLLFILFALAGMISASAQTTNWPLTLFETAQSMPDASLVHGTVQIGTISSDVAATVEVAAESLNNLQTSQKTLAVSLKSRIMHHTQIDYIDYDELDPLIRALQRMQQNDQALASQFDTYAITFRTRGGLVFSKFLLEGKTLASIKSPNSVSEDPNLMNTSTLRTLEQFLASAKSKLDVLRQIP
jgi:hypothetical protein